MERYKLVSSFVLRPLFSTCASSRPLEPCYEIEYAMRLVKHSRGDPQKHPLHSLSQLNSTRTEPNRPDPKTLPRSLGNDINSFWSQLDCCCLIQTSPKSKALNYSSPLWSIAFAKQKTFQTRDINKISVHILRIAFALICFSVDSFFCALY